MRSLKFCVLSAGFTQLRFINSVDRASQQNRSSLHTTVNNTLSCSIPLNKHAKKYSVQKLRILMRAILHTMYQLYVKLLNHYSDYDSCSQPVGCN
jgi:hypothetical protein